jgi:hypothetical protein
LRAALVSIEISALTFLSKISESNAFCAPAAPLPSTKSTRKAAFLAAQAYRHADPDRVGGERRVQGHQ